MSRTSLSIAAASLMFAWAAPSWAQDLVYEPINPSFGGNAFNSAHLLAIANAQNDYDPPEPDRDDTQDQLDRFVRSLQSRLLSSLSTQVANAIFGEDAQDEGTIVFGDQTINFVRTLEGIQLTITNADGSQTVITIPTFQTTSDDDEDEDEDDSEGSSKLTLVRDYSAPGALREDFLALSAKRSSEYLALNGAKTELGPRRQTASPDLNLLQRSDVLASTGEAPIQ